MSIDTTAIFKIHYEKENHIDTGTLRINIDIDWEGNFTVNRIQYAYNSKLNMLEIDSVKSGCFVGKLNTQELNSLRREINLSNYKNLNINVPHDSHGERLRLDIWDVSSLHSLRLYHPAPIVLDRLIRTIGKISLTDDLHRCK